MMQHRSPKLPTSDLSDIDKGDGPEFAQVRQGIDTLLNWAPQTGGSVTV